MQPKWKTFEDQVRGIATLTFGKTCLPDRIAGVNFDGVVAMDLETVVIEISKQNDLDKVRQGITRLTLARQTLSVDGILLRGYIVLNKTPTQAMIEAAKSAKITVASVTQFASLFFNFGRYNLPRQQASFGSSIDPATGEIDQVSYVPVNYQRLDGGKELGVADIGDLLLSGKKIVLLGEYGSGKSRCVRELYGYLSGICGETFAFPFAVNLRECWGLDRGDEIIRRGVYTLGLDDLAPSAVRALNRDAIIPLLDGFDELGSQSWSSDESRLRQLRARALAGVKDLILKTKMGCLISGREHYFSSNEELMSALGLQKNNTIFIKAKDEFTDSELEEYFEAAGLIVELPSWLPKRPLICQTIALLSDDELGSMFGATSEGVEFWNHFIKVVCKRDARINSFFDAETIYRVFVALSRITRRCQANIGPISQRDLQDAFEAVVGQLPVEEASVMLQRLPSLGRIGAESQDRQFVDMFILDGLRAKDVSTLLEVDESIRRQTYRESWLNPLAPLGQTILAEDLKGHTESFRQIAEKSSTEKNTTLAADIVAAMSRTDAKTIDMQSLKISDAIFSEFTLVETPLQNVEIANSTFEHLVLPNSPPSNVQIKSCLAHKVSGAASYSGLPSWVHLELVDEFDTVQTVAQIRRVGLTPAHEILVAVLKKTFMQKGSGRKEEALLRGFGGGASKKLASLVLSCLMREGILTRHKGDEGWIYSPDRGQGGRISAILDQLRSSRDPLWEEIGELNR